MLRCQQSNYNLKNIHISYNIEPYYGGNEGYLLIFKM